ncbi:MAG: carotenoid oxygenase family protein [Novosphingobium sp.]|uniref:carotenoid oxygenase family protein n=1 Tax=Novosphingobium sp. TaxID=1874826 RepID=UPI003016D0DD
MNPYLAGNFAPVTEEVTATQLAVTGELPKELNGRYLRNGPNPLGDTDPAAYHWFTGTGMVHGLRLSEGRAEWYRNRYVGGDAVAKALGRSITGPNWSGGANGPNTNVGGFAGRTWAMVEAGGTPVELTYELDSVARNDFFGTLPGAFTAHPKFDPASGELHAVAYAPGRWMGHVQYIVVGKDGRVRRTVDVPMGPSMVHDMSLTEKYAVVYDLPVTLDMKMAQAGSRFPFSWNPDYGARVGFLPREGTAQEIVWIEIPLCYAYHPMNAYDRADGSVVIDICAFDRMFDHDRNGPIRDSLPRLERWEFDIAGRRSSVTVIDQTPQEFPRHAASAGTREYRFGYSVGFGSHPAGMTFKHDLVTGTRFHFDYGPGRGAGEAVFVPRETPTAEDDGWLLAFAHDFGGGASSFVVLDAQDLERGPVAEVHLPQRVPFGFHGNWVSDASVPPEPA